MTTDAQEGHFERPSATEAAEGEHCKECHPELHRAQCWRGGCVVELQAELDELERTDPDVAAAAASYDRMVERITGRTLPPRCTCAVRSDAIGPHTRGCPNHPEASR